MLHFSFNFLLSRRSRVLFFGLSVSLLFRRVMLVDYGMLTPERNKNSESACRLHKIYLYSSSNPTNIQEFND